MDIDYRPIMADGLWLSTIDYLPKKLSTIDHRLSTKMAIAPKGH
jgi:hypothetical protein